jgi:Fe-S-cluster-containing hydrogenase component 2
MVHSCKEVCPKGAITIVNHKATVDKEKCIECGKCTQACPYSAIILQHRPCMVSCKVKAISMDENHKATIDNEKCISCGACVYKCPFGAISDKSLVLDIIDILKKSENNTKYKVYAVIAPAIVSQCRFGRVTQVVTAIRKLGFHHVVEAALGADAGNVLIRTTAILGAIFLLNTLVLARLTSTVHSRSLMARESEPVAETAPAVPEAPALPEAPELPAAPAAEVPAAPAAPAPEAK